MEEVIQQPVIDCKSIFKDLCSERSIPFETIDSVISYDLSTLFCPAGMQKYKNKFQDQEINGVTLANVQSCLRLNDLDLIGDGTHSIVFDMIGLFSFRHWEVKDAISFFLDFIRRCGIEICHVTIHPDKLSDWRDFYPQSMEIVPDIECEWSDGNVGGYCTEFYSIGNEGVPVEIGNIVNPLGNCIDVGFGADRINSILNKTFTTRENEFIRACESLTQSGISPSNVKHGYILRKILRTLIREGFQGDLKFINEERVKMQRMEDSYFKLLPKNKDKTDEWWWDTHGINPKEIKQK